MPDASIDDAIRSKLQALIANGPAERKSKLETTLDPHRDLIAQAIAKGHTFRSITTALREAGLKASPETVRRYVQRISGPKTKRPTRRTSANTKATA